MDERQRSRRRAELEAAVIREREAVAADERENWREAATEAGCDPPAAAGPVEDPGLTGQEWQQADPLIEDVIQLERRHEALLETSVPLDALTALEECLLEASTLVRGLRGWLQLMTLKAISPDLIDLYRRKVEWLAKQLDEAPPAPGEPEKPAPAAELKALRHWCTLTRTTLSPLPKAEAALEIATGILWLKRNPNHILDGEHDLTVMKLMAEKSPNTVTRDVFEKHGITKDVDVWRIKDRHVKAGWPEELFWSQGKNGIGFKVRVRVMEEDPAEGV